MTERIFINTDDVFITEEEQGDIKSVRKSIYSGKHGEDAEVAICVWIWSSARLDKLNNCIDNILKYTSHIPFKLVLIDNGAGEEVVKYYESIAHDDKLIIHVSKNISSPHGAGTAMKFVQNKYIAQVLNDCIVTPNWLDNLLTCMKSDEDIGWVCPMSTNVSNQQQVDIGDLDSIDEIQEFARNFNISDEKKWEQRLRLMPICGLYKREGFDLAGIYDPGYLHEYSDDDLCIRFRRAGYKLILCKDTFVYHDHPLSSRNNEVEMSHSILGSRGFNEKFNQIEPWGDMNNFIFHYIETLTLSKEKENYSILGIDVKCGTPVLDIKNFYRKHGKLTTTSHVLTTNVKYYTDLCTIADKVVHDNDVHSVGKYYQGKYDFIVCDEYVNKYFEPVKLLTKLVELLDEQGFLLFPIKNTYDLNTLLCTLGHAEYRSPENFVDLHYFNVLLHLQDLSTEIKNVFTIYHYIAETQKNVIKTDLMNLKLLNNADETIDRIMTDTYWICVQKK